MERSAVHKNIKHKKGYARLLNFLSRKQLKILNNSFQIFNSSVDRKRH